MPQGCRCLSAAGPGVLLVTEEILTGKKPASNPVLTAGSPVTENYRFRSAAGSRVWCWLQRNYCSHAYKSSADNRFTGYRGLPAIEICW